MVVVVVSVEVVVVVFVIDVVVVLLLEDVEDVDEVLVAVVLLEVELEELVVDAPQTLSEVRDSFRGHKYNIILRIIYSVVCDEGLYCSIINSFKDLKNERGEAPIKYFKKPCPEEAKKLLLEEVLVDELVLDAVLVYEVLVVEVLLVLVFVKLVLVELVVVELLVVELVVVPQLHTSNKVKKIYKCDSSSVIAFRKLVLVLVKVKDVDVTVLLVLLLDVEEVVEPVQVWDTQWKHEIAA